MDYTISINSDRVHISMDTVPVETYLFSTFADKHNDGKDIAIGIAVCKAIELNKGSVIVNDLS